MELQGKYIREALEYGLETKQILQVSGIKVVFDLSRETGKKIDSLLVLCRVCDVPRYSSIHDEEWYRIIMPSFLGNGGDGFLMFREKRRNFR